MKYNGLFLVPKLGENKPMEHEAQPKKAAPPRSKEYMEGFREGFQAGCQKRFEYETSSTRR
jgi:hypothetical protein